MLVLLSYQPSILLLFFINYNTGNLFSMQEEKLKNGPCEKTRVEVFNKSPSLYWKYLINANFPYFAGTFQPCNIQENSKDAEIATGVSLSHSVSDSMACIPNTKRTLRSKSNMNYHLIPQRQHLSVNCNLACLLILSQDFSLLIVLQY